MVRQAATVRATIQAPHHHFSKVPISPPPRNSGPLTGGPWSLIHTAAYCSLLQPTAAAAAADLAAAESCRPSIEGLRLYDSLFLPPPPPLYDSPALAIRQQPTRPLEMVEQDILHPFGGSFLPGRRKGARREGGVTFERCKREIDMMMMNMNMNMDGMSDAEVR